MARGDLEISNNDIVKMYPVWDRDHAPSLPVHRYDDQTGDYAIDKIENEGLTIT